MGKIARVFQNLFGVSGSQSHFGQFGSANPAISPAPFYTQDPATIQSLSAFINNGWKDAINTGNKAAFLEDMNGLFLLVFYQLSYLMQQGIAEWDPSTPYFTGSMVQDGLGNVYVSLTNSNVNNALPNQASNANWQYFNPASVPSGNVSAFAGSSAPFGYLFCDGTSYAQATYPALYSNIGSTWNLFNSNVDPGAGNFRVPDLRSMTLMGVGQGNGLSTRTLAQFVGEENHILDVGEIPGNLTVDDPGHSHRMPTGLVASGGNNTTAFYGGDNNPTAVSATGIRVGGGGGAHNTMQPTAGVNWIIKT